MKPYLSVRLSGAFGERNITSEVAALSFRSEGNGGFKSASFQLARPIHQQAPELAALNKVYVYDSRSPRQIAWQGYLEDPGRAAESRGLLWTVNAVGPSARLKDRASPIVYVDKRLNQWRRGELVAADGPDTSLALKTTMGTFEGIFFPGWMLQMNNGSSMGIGDAGAIVYELLKQSGQHIGSFIFNFMAGNGDANWQIASGATGGGSGFTTHMDEAFSTSSAAWQLLITTDYAVDRNMIWVFVKRINASVNVVDDTTYSFVHKFHVLGTRYNKSGTELTAASNYGNGTHVLASQVVEDILGRWMPTYDRVNANIATTTFQITQLAYSDPVRPAQILEDLSELEPDFRWAVWGDTQNGTNEFEYVRWDSGDVFEYDPYDGFSSPESSSDMYSDVMIRYDDGTGFTQTFTSTQTVPALQGLRRFGVVDLGGDRGVSAENTAQAAAAFLAEHNTPSSSGTLTVARPVLNVTKGLMVDPWMIRPGTLLRLRGVQARPDYLNAIDHNGVTLFRVVATEFSSSSGVATLELEGYSPTLARQLSEHKRMMWRLGQFSTRFGG